MSDILFMKHALDLAARPGASPSPNPRVGAVVVRDGVILGEGFHTGPGTPHAEEAALRSAGPSARGAVLYCNLEPCSFTGNGKRRPPCAPLIIRSGIRRVVISQLDPNPKVYGGGKKMLEEAGVEVRTGLDVDVAVVLNAGFNTFMTLGRPYVHIKCAQSLDGRIAAADGSSRWITGADARDHVHRERGLHDAVAVGIETVLRDDPSLTVRRGPPRRPAAVVLDSRARLSADSRLVRDRPHETFVVAGPYAPSERTEPLERLGVRVLRARGCEQGIDLGSALELLAREGILSLYVEGGSRVISSFLRAGLYDRITSYIAPLLIGGRHIGLDPPPAAAIDSAVRLERANCEAMGVQAVLSGYRPGWWERILYAVDPRERSVPKEAADVYGTR